MLQRLWVVSLYMVVCPLMKCPGKEDSLFHYFSLNFSNLRLWLFKKDMVSIVTSLNHLWCHYLCTYLTKASCYVFRQLQFSNNFWGQAKTYFLLQVLCNFQKLLSICLELVGNRLHVFFSLSKSGKQYCPTRLVGIYLVTNQERYFCACYWKP